MYVIHDRAAVELPCAPRERTEDLDGMRVHTFSSKSSRGDFFWFQHARMPDNFDPSDTSTFERVMGDSRRELTRELNGKLVKKRLIASAQGLDGREYWIEGGGEFSGATLYLRFFLVDKRMYYLGSSTQSGGGPDRRVRSFLDSFRIKQ